MVSIYIKLNEDKKIEINNENIVYTNLDNMIMFVDKNIIKYVYALYYKYKDILIKEYDNSTNMRFNQELYIVDENNNYIFNLLSHLSAQNFANEIFQYIESLTNQLKPVNESMDVASRLLEFVNSDEYKREEITFEWNEEDNLRNVSDESLELVLKLLKKTQYKINSTEDKIVLNNNIKNFCDFESTTKDLIEEDNLIVKPATYTVGKNTSINRICIGCKLQRCPKHLLAFIHYLASTNNLEKMLKDREKYLNRNDMYTFDWKYNEVFKYIPDNLYNFCDELNNKNLIYVYRYLPNKDNLINIKSYYNCLELKVMDLKIEELKEVNVEISQYKANLKRNINNFNLTCKDFICALPGCVIGIAALIQYLKNSGRESEIIEQRKYYHEHQEECDEQYKNMIDNKLKEYASKLEEYIDKLNSYNSTINNIDTLISIINNTSSRNLFITIEGNDSTKKNELINDIHKFLFESDKIDNKIVDRISLYNLAASNAYPRTIRDIKDKDINGTNYCIYEEVKYTVLKPKNLYVIDSIKEFIKDYNEMKDKANNNAYLVLKSKQFKHILDLLSDISANNYIILDASDKEIESLFEIEPRLQYIYQNNRYIVPEFSLEDTFNAYAMKLNNNLYNKYKEDKEKYKKEFLEYVGLNKNFIPFDNRELASYLAMYSNLKNDIVFPQSMYKKESVEEALQNIIGLDTVKQKVKEFEKYMLFKVKAESNNLKLASSNMHMIFTGNTGTGKTTVARIMAKMLYDMGIIKENKLIEVERKDLVAEYIGQTATKTSTVIEKALGGVLFVDEAYTLSSESKNDFGAEAIATLIKAMEDQKDNLVVIFAGYENEMKSFLDINPGITSRIGYTFNFQDYSVNELKEIFYKKIDKMGFNCEPDCDIKLFEICEYFSKRKSFGNGRFVDKLIQATMLKHAISDSEKLELISASDIPTIKELNNSNDSDQTTSELLEDIIGLEDLKVKIGEFENYVKFVSKARKKNLTIPNQNLHMIFTGNPGTGKTTIARIMAKILYNAGIIHENKLVEVEKKDLISKYTGETASKTSSVIEKAMGGILFVDEAYSLTNSRGSSYGSEAIDTLIKAMEDHKGEFIVIFAGYKKEMADFINMNSGIASRIGYTFNFEDYTREELEQILYKKIDKSGLIIEEEAKEKVKTIMNYFAKVQNIGNGRFVDKVFQEILIKHSKNKDSEIEVLTIDDIPTIKDITSSLFDGENMINPDEITEKSLKKTAIHEIGHALVRYKLFDSPEIVKITINSEGTGVLGYVQFKAKTGEYTKTKSTMLKQIMSLMGGMASEEVFLGEFANGNSSDLEKASSIAYNMITNYGMSKFGYGKIFKTDGEMSVIIQKEINDILKECYEKTISLIKENKDKMTKVIDYLYNEKEIDEETFLRIFNSN